MNIRRVNALFVLMILTLGLNLGCRQHMSIKMNDTVPPVFTFHASPFTHYKHLTFFIVIELAPGNEKIPAYESPPAEDKAVWWIFPGDAQRGDYKNLPEITYGIVPAGWTQKTPSQGRAPALIEGKFYQAGGPQIEVPWATMRFTIRNGKAVRVPFYSEEFQKQQ